MCPHSLIKKLTLIFVLTIYFSSTLFSWCEEAFFWNIYRPCVCACWRSVRNMRYGQACLSFRPLGWRIIFFLFIQSITFFPAEIKQTHSSGLFAWTCLKYHTAISQRVSHNRQMKKTWNFNWLLNGRVFSENEKENLAGTPHWVMV